MPLDEKLMQLEKNTATAALDHVNLIELYGEAVTVTKKNRTPENVSKMLTRETELLASALRMYEAMKAERRHSAKRGKKK